MNRGLEELVRRNMAAGRLYFTTDLREVLDDVEVVLVQWVLLLMKMVQRI